MKSLLRAVVAVGVICVVSLSPGAASAQVRGVPVRSARLSQASCPFCGVPNNPIPGNRILHRTPDYFIAPSQGTMGQEGYLLQIPTGHVPSLADLSPKDHEAFFQSTRKIVQAVKEAYGPPVVFEHGITGQSIAHAHLHILPGLDFDRLVAETERLLCDGASACAAAKKEIDPDDARREKREAKAASGGYLYLEEPASKRAVVFAVEPGPERLMILRKAAAAALGRPEAADWKKARANHALVEQDEAVRQKTIDRLIGTSATDYRGLLVKLGLRSRILAGRGLDLDLDGSVKPVANPIRLAAFDNDENLVYMDSKIYLRHKATKEEAAVPTAEFARLRPQIGKSGKYGDYELFDTSEPRGSFRDFHWANTEAFVEAMRRSLGGFEADMWRGPSWFPFVLALAGAKTAPWVAVITSRGTMPDDLARGFDLLKERGYLESVPRPDLLFGVGAGSTFDRIFDRSMTMPERKLVFITELLDLLESVPIIDASAAHAMSFSDDDADMIGRVKERLEIEQSQRGRWPRVKIHLYSTGAGKEWKATLTAPRLQRTTDKTEPGK